MRLEYYPRLRLDTSPVSPKTKIVLTAYQKSLILSKKAFLFDLDGTLYLGDQVLPGARELITKLRAENKKILFLSNNSSRSEGDYLKKLTKMGFQPKPKEILISTRVLIHELKSKKIRRVFLLGTPAMKRLLQSDQIKVTEKKPQMVIVGFDKTLTYAKLWKASQFISKGIPYGVTHPDYFCPHPKGPEPDCGAIAILLERTTKKTPRFVLGKPHPKVIQTASKILSVARRDMVVFGDRLSTDIQMAFDAKITSVFVLSGDNSKKDLKKFKARPTVIAKSLFQFI